MIDYDNCKCMGATGSPEGKNPARWGPIYHKYISNSKVVTHD